jgi:sugar phosphate isomerase/epimerase
MTTRRTLLQQLAVATAVVATGSRHRRLLSQEVIPAWPIAIFEKVFEGLSYEELATAIDQIGADGVEATIRPGGHIAPEAAADEVPKMAEALRQRGKRILIAATQIRGVDEPHTEPLLRLFKVIGITHYRLGYYPLDSARPLRQQVAEHAARARSLAVLNREIGVHGLYQNHAGARYLGALAWDLAHLLEDVDPDWLGVACDLRHLRAETGLSWQTAVQLLRPHIRAIYVKDAVWDGPRSERLRDVPLDTGFVTDEVFELVRRGLPPMPLCIHMEHLGYRVFEKHEIPAAIRAHQDDIAALRRWLRE